MNSLDFVPSEVPKKCEKRADDRGRTRGRSESRLKADRKRKPRSQDRKSRRGVGEDEKGRHDGCGQDSFKASDSVLYP